ncbi:18532_t:CDS:1, partial [Funneliformis geosporum]
NSNENRIFNPENNHENRIFDLKNDHKNGIYDPNEFSTDTGNDLHSVF